MSFKRKLLRGTVPALAVAVMFSAVASAQFIGPSGQPPSGGGALFVSTSSRAIIINTSTIYSANPLAFQVATSTFTGTVTASAFIGPFSGSVSAANITGPSAFGSNYGTYSYAFPGALAIGTSTTSGLPTSGLFVSGSVGIGTSSPAQALEVVGNIKISGTSNGIIFPDGTTQTTASTGGGGGDSVWSATSTGIYYNGGKVGIGTASPTGNLEILVPAIVGRENPINVFISDAPGARFGVKNTTGTSNTAEIAFFGTSPAAGRHSLIFQGLTLSTYDSGTTPLLGFFAATYSGDPITGSFGSPTVRPLFGWGNNSGFLMMMDKNGYLGIGTSTPAQKLEVVGNIKVSGASNGIIFADGTKQTTAGGGGGDGIWTASSTIIYYNDGNVGLGTVAPAQKLEVVGGIKITGASNGITFPDGTTQTTAGGGGSSQWTTTSTGIYYSGGTVGIGMNPDSDRLSVSGNVYASGGLFTSDSTGVNYMMGKLALGAASAGTAQLYVNGNVGLGTTAPAADLHLYDSGTSTPILLMQNASSALRVLTNSGVNYVQSGTSTTSGTRADIRFTSMNAAATFMTIQGSTGYVGIGTTGPSYTLDVSGTFRATGNWSLGGGAQTALNMNAQNITGVAKLSVATIDPLYEIAGAKYSTYAASIAGGVKEEYVGNAAMKGSRFVLDFDSVEKGSDLWVWRSVIDFSNDTVQVFTTPIGKPVAVSYEIQGNQIIFESTEPVAFSYRLIGSRYDWKDHPTYAHDQTEETILKIK